MEIVLIRHGESTANVEARWQGQGNSPLTDEGRRQSLALGRRFGPDAFDLVVASDLDRAADTARALGGHVELDPSWREIDLGRWEGKTFDEVQREAGDLLAALRAGEQLRLGGSGESPAEFEERITDSLGRLAERLGDAKAAVVTHGGVIDAIVGRLLGRPSGRRGYPIVENTAVTLLVGEPDAFRLRRFNDATHLGRETRWVTSMRRDGVPVVAFVRHGVTAANKERRIQGQSGAGLDAEGREQARRLAAWYGPVDRVWTSPLARAADTALALADGRPPTSHPLLVEMGFGEWEGVLYQEVLDSEDPWAHRIYREGEDLPRGRTGERFTDVVERMRRFLAEFDPDPSERTVVVSHGAAIRALVAAIMGRGPEINAALATVDNTGVTHVALTPEGPMLADYSLAPHLE